MKTLEHLRESIRLAHAWTSFDPEKRAEQMVNDYSDQLDKDIVLLKELRASEEWIAKYKELYLKKFEIWIAAKSRCASAAVAGPAKFPVEKQKKAHAMADRRMNELFEWRSKSLTSSRNYEFKKEAQAEMKANAQPNKEFVIIGGTVIFNYEIDRIQIKHDVKPEQEVIDKLKARAFKWSPRYKVWQRQLTANGILAAELVLNIKLG